MVVKRTHTAANVAPAIAKLLEQVNKAYPNRLKTTVGHDADGIWPSAAHTAANPNSDHEAGNALDIDDDLSGTQAAPQVTPAMAALLSNDPRCNYTIHDNRIYRGGSSKPYTGSSPHTGHIHVSVHESKRAQNQPWRIKEATTVAAKNKIGIILYRPALQVKVEAMAKELGVKLLAVDADTAVVERLNAPSATKL